MSAWANVTPKEDECICEHNCIEEGLNTDCPVCRKDIMRCEGLCTIEDEDPVEEKEPVRKERQKMGPLTPSGNMTLVDDYGSDEKEGKQFITLVTKSGNYFYLIIDRDDQGEETIHFLNMVDEADLMALMDDPAGEDTESEEFKVQPFMEEAPEEAEEPEEEPQGDRKNPLGGLLVLLLLSGMGFGGYMYYKSTKSKKDEANMTDPDADYIENDDEFLDNLDDEEDEEKLEEVSKILQEEINKNEEEGDNNG